MNEPDRQLICKDYVGRTQTHTETLSPFGVNGLLATLNDTATLGNGDSIPALFHWLYFNPPVPASQLKSDGHEVLGSFLPPVPYPRRMWAGSSLEFQGSLVLGETTTRHSSIKSIDFKSGTSGKLCFVNVEHCFFQQNTLRLTDIHTIVYREDTGTKPTSTPTTNTNTDTDTDTDTDKGIAAGSSTQSLNSITLFRYSALTFNSHRIHYDKDYCRAVEGYPDLVVHGPLMATLLVRHIQNSEPDRLLSTFSFRALAPVFAEDAFKLESHSEADTTTASLIKSDGTLAMSAKTTWLS